MNNLRESTTGCVRHGREDCDDCFAEATMGDSYIDTLQAERDRYREALAALIDAGEPYVGEAFPTENMNGSWLRTWNCWLAAMNDAREALEGPADA